MNFAIRAILTSVQSNRDPLEVGREEAELCVAPLPNRTVALCAVKRYRCAVGKAFEYSRGNKVKTIVVGTRSRVSGG